MISHVYTYFNLHLFFVFNAKILFFQKIYFVYLHKKMTSSCSELLDSDFNIIDNILNNEEFDTNYSINNVENEFLAFFDDVGGPEMAPSPIIHNNIESDEDNFSSEEYLDENYEEIEIVDYEKG